MRHRGFGVPSGGAADVPPESGGSPASDDSVTAPQGSEPARPEDSGAAAGPAPGAAPDARADGDRGGAGESVTAPVPPTTVDRGGAEESVTAPAPPTTGDRGDSGNVGFAEPRRRRRVVRRAVSWAMLVVGLALFLGAAWTGWRAYQAYHHLSAAKDVVTEITSEFKTSGISNPSSLTALAGKLAEDTASARQAVQDPVYRAATLLPWLGPNLQAVRQVAITFDPIAQAARAGLPAILPLADHAKWAAGGTFDLSVIRPAASAVGDIDAAVEEARKRIGGVDRQSLIGTVATSVDQYSAELGKMAGLTAGGAKAARLIVPMLGGDGPRNYLVVFQNLAESRATGGIFGFYANLHVEGGKLTLGKSGSSDRDLGPFSTPVGGLDPAVGALYGPGMASFPQNVNLTPDFPTAAQLFAEMYRTRTGQAVDGVIALDPVVVSVLMQGVAPIPLGHGLVLSSGTAVKVLLSDIYTVFPGGAHLAQRDDLMRTATAAAFSAVLANVGHLDPKALLSDVDHLTDQRRILVWSANDSEEAGLVTTAVGGRFGPDTQGRPVLGVFLDDATGAKLDYYQHGTVRLGAPTCRSDGGAAAVLTFDLVNKSPSSGLPPYVVGASNNSTAGPYKLITNVVLTGPAAGSIQDVRVDGKPPAVRTGDDRGRSVVVLTVSSTPGQTVTVTATVVMDPLAQGGAGGTVQPTVVTTPMATPITVQAASFPACGR